MTRPRLLVVGHALRPTGYARVLASVLPHLADAFDVTLFALNHYGDPPADAGGLPYDLRTNRLLGDRTAAEQLPPLLSELEPDVVLLHDDSSVLANQRPALDDYRHARPGARAVVWCPLDWLRPRRPVARALAGMDLVVLYTEVARRAARRAFAEHGLPAPPTAVVGHGVDTKTFRPLVPGDRAASRALARERLFPELGDAFVVLNANARTRRKRVDLTEAAFGAMAATRPRARLHLHGSGTRGQLDDEELNLLYNACDVGVNTAAAEGFGLVSFEHAATGAAQVVPDAGATAELWRGHAMLAPAEPQEMGALVSVDGAADALARLHDDPALLDEMSARALEHARSRAFDWAAVAERWRGLLLGEVAAAA